MRSNYGLVVAASLAVAVIFWAACGDDDDDSSSPTEPPPIVTPIAPTPTPEVSDPETGPTGIAVIDRAITAMTDGELAPVIDLIVLEPVACVVQPQGLGAPPECTTDEAAGTPVDVVLFASCEGYYVREFQLEMNLARFVEGDVELYGVFGTNTTRFGGADFVAVFSAEREGGTLAQLLYFTDEGIVGVDYGCGQTPAQFVETQVFTDVVVAPE